MGFSWHASCTASAAMRTKNPLLRSFSISTLDSLALVLLLASGCAKDVLPGSRVADEHDPGGGASQAGENEEVCSEDEDGTPVCRVSVGAATPNAFDPDSSGSSGVTVEDGAIVLIARSIASHLIWIANTSEGSISKFDTRTFEELGRYMTGPSGRGNDPSRTSVNTLGDVYVGNRDGGTVTRISALGGLCEDANGDGSVTTSDGREQVLAWGQDDCVAWNTDLARYPGAPGRKIRAVAAQDVEQPDGTIKQYVWVGAHTDSRIFKLDGLTGEVLLHAKVPLSPYGFALDGSGRLWIASSGANQIGSVDTNTCSASNCPTDLVSLPDTTYGITVDAKQRVWTGGPTIKRYDPSTGEIIQKRPTTIAGTTFAIVHGIAADGAGWIWGAALTTGVLRVNADNPDEAAVVPGTSGYSNKGVAVDTDGKVWSIALLESRALVLTPGAGLNDVAVNPDVATSLTLPYTYSDMTGLQLLLATGARTTVVPIGNYRRTFRGCKDDQGEETEWRQLEWDADVPEGTSISFRFRVADSDAELASAEWLPLASVPPDAAPASIRDALRAMQADHAPYLEIDAALQSRRGGDPSTVSPRLNSLSVSYACSKALQ